MNWTALLAATALAYAPLAMPPNELGQSASRPATDAALPSRLAFRLADADWQPLPRGVHDAGVSPDGRLWLMVARQERHMDPAAVRERWTREFNEAMPQVEWGNVALFEPRADDSHALERVWFARGNANMAGTPMLWGYEGKVWVERQAPPHDEAGGSGRWQHESAVYAGGRTWFFSGGQAVSFDGQQWQTHGLLEFDPKQEGSLHLVSRAGGQGDLYVYLGLHKVGRARLLRWQSGNWKDLELPPGIGRPEEMVPVEDGLLILASGRLVHVSLQPVREPPAAVVEDIRLLGDPDFAKREAATQRLLEVAWPHLAHIRALEAKETEPERRNRLRMIIATLEGRIGARAGRPMSYFAGYQLETCTRLHRSTQGTVRALALAVRDQENDYGPAELILVPGAAPRVETVLHDETSGYSARGRIAEWLGPDGKLIQWEQRLEEAVRHLPPTAPPRNRTLVRTSGSPAAVPLSSFEWPVVALPDGGVVVRGPGGSPELSDNPLMMYRPDNPPVPRLHGTARRVWQMHVAPDGLVWTSDTKGWISRFDGRQWSAPLKPPNADRSSPWLPLGGELVLVAPRGGAWRYDGERLVDTDAGARRLIERNADLLRRELRKPGRTRPRQVSGVLVLSADDAGNLWFIEQEKLAVLAGDRWIEVSAAIDEKFPHFGSVGACLPARDGAVHYINDFSPSADHGATVLARVADGKLEFTRIMASTSEMRFHRPVYDESGSLYVPVALTEPGVNDQSIVRGHGTLQLEGWAEAGEDEPARVKLLEGVPWLFDEGSGLLWLLNAMPYRGEAVARLFKGEKARMGINLPGMGRFTHHKEYAIALRHDSGDIFIVAAYGLIRLSPRETGDGRYRVPASFYLPDFEGRAVRDAWILGDDLMVLSTTGVLQTYALAESDSFWE